MILCLEFAVALTPSQQATVDQWMDVSRVIYNEALSRLNQWDEFTGYWVKEEKRCAPCCPVPWEYGWVLDPTSTPNNKIFVRSSFCRVLSPSSHYWVKALPRVRIPTGAEQKDSWGWSGGWGYSCPIPRHYQEPLLQRWELKITGGLGEVIKGSYWPEGHSVLSMPYKFRAGVLTMLETPWQEYLKTRYGKIQGPRRGKPKFKSRSKSEDRVNTVIHPNPKGVIVPKGNRLTGVPTLGQLQVKGLCRRWRNPDGTVPPVATFKILRRGAQYFVQLTGDLERSFPVKPTEEAVGIDPGLVAIATTSRGETIEAKRRYRTAQDRRTELQQRLAHKRTHRLILWLNHPDRTIAEVRQFIPLSNKAWDQLKGATTEKALIDAIGSSRVNTLKFKAVPESKRLVALDAQHKALESRLSRSRKAEDDKLTSRWVRNYGAIAIEDGLQDQKLRGKAKAKVKEDGTGYAHNNAAAKSGLNKSLSDASPGRKIAMLQRKAKRSDRNFVKVAAANTSRTCPCCGSEYPAPMDGDRMFRCGTCGWTLDRDISAGVNIELKAFALDPVAELSPLAHTARVYGCFWVEETPKGSKPLWMREYSTKRLLGLLAGIREAYSAGDLEILRLQWMYMRKAIKPIRETEP